MFAFGFPFPRGALESSIAQLILMEVCEFVDFIDKTRTTIYFAV
jgi:hypothetical protein